MNHTPTPWKIDDKKKQMQQMALGGIALKSYRKDYDEYCAFAQLNFGNMKKENCENASFIVTACNAHEDLKNSLKDFVQSLEDLYKTQPKIAGEYFGAALNERAIEALIKAGVKV